MCKESSKKGGQGVRKKKLGRKVCRKSNKELGKKACIKSIKELGKKVY